MSPDGHVDCFSYWYSPEIAVENGKLYRVNYTMGSTCVDPDDTVSFRVRVNQEGSWQGWESVINSNLQHAPSESEPKTYSVYIMPNVTGTNGDENIILSGDIMSFDYTDDLMSWITLEAVQVEEIDIDPGVVMDK